MAERSAPYHDSADKTLEDYPRPSVAVDTAVLTVPESGRLSVLLTLTNDAAASGGASGGPGEWRLPGSFLHPGETLSDAALRSLREKAGVDGLRPRQLRVFDAPGRDNRGWVLSVAHLDAVRADRIPLIERTRLVPVDELPTLQYDHREIVAAAVDALRDEYRRSPDPAGLLPSDWDSVVVDATQPTPDAAQSQEPDGAFTMRDLRHLHEAVLGEQLVADTFRRTMLPDLRATGQMRRGGRGKPAELFLSISR